ncbi:MAG TPA: SWIM zinc finger family protein [Acetobacteraceae bacterium]|nr:SWIM zinc finger family protein [Acetobacteraceae bacterium]
MSTYYGGWAPYVPVAERRRRAERAMKELRRTGDPVAPVTIKGRLIATTFWGRAWCDNIQSYRDYESRLPRGQTYVRNGSVVDLQIARGRITALVCGSELYRITVTVKETARTRWRAICADCTGGIDSLIELLQGRLSKGVMERLCRQESGLFPRPSDIRFSCSCPDHALMCKHVAAVLYGVGARLDHEPELLFRLRAVDETDLVARIDTALPLSKNQAIADKALQTDDISALFGIDMAEAPEAARPPDGARRSSARGMAPRTMRVAAPVAAATAASSRSAVPTKHMTIAGRTPAGPSASKKAATKIRKVPVKAAVSKQKAAAAQNTTIRSRASKRADIARPSPEPAVPMREKAVKKAKPKPRAKVRATVRPAKRAG